LRKPQSAKDYRQSALSIERGVFYQSDVFLRAKSSAIQKYKTDKKSIPPLPPPTLRPQSEGFAQKQSRQLSGTRVQWFILH
jgi:hypothetical protein